MCDFFLPLGGADEIGASAYFLSLDGHKILLDCGARTHGEELYPDYSLLESHGIRPEELDLILISHGHYDHIGSFSEIARRAEQAKILCTPDTKRMLNLQLLDFGRVSGRPESERVKQERYRITQLFLSRVEEASVNRELRFKDLSITFLPAGHMPGAVMILLKAKGQTLLYTGDFSRKTMFGINGMNLPADLQVDTLLINATHAYKTAQSEGDAPKPQEKDLYIRHLENLRDHMRQLMEKGRKIYLVTNSVPKQLDMIYFLQDAFEDIPVYLEEKSQKLVRALADFGYSVYGRNIHDCLPEKTNPESHILVGMEKGRAGYVTVNFDGYSLHASYEELIDFVDQLQPHTTYTLHTSRVFGRKFFGDDLRKKGFQGELIRATNEKKYYLKKETMMKHLDIYKDVLDYNLTRAKEYENTDKVMNPYEWLAIYGSFSNPAPTHPMDAYRSLPRRLLIKSGASFDDYMNALKTMNLDSEERRRYALSLTEQGVELLKKALEGEREDVEKYSDFLRKLEYRDRNNHRFFYLGKLIVNFMILLDPDLKDPAYESICATFGGKYCNRMIRRIRDQIYERMGLERKKRSARDVLAETEEALRESTSLSDSLKGNELDRLKFQNENYRNSLELVQTRLDELKDSIEEAAQEARDSAITSFYSEMNSEQYGNLLDSMELVELRLADLKKQGVKIPPQIMPLSILFKQLLRFYRSCGITPIDSIGREFSANAKELADFTYIGDPFLGADERKPVRVERPGWKYGNRVISLPTVREKDEEESL